MHPRHHFRVFLAGAALVAGLLNSPALTAAQTTGSAPAAPAPAAPAQAGTRDQTPPQIFETVTVSATLNPSTVKDTPGTVSVIDAATIRRRLIENMADLVKFEPGVYVETNLTRVGLNGFNIRGIGGNRVMTQVDGVDTSEQFDFGPFNVHQFGLDPDTLKSAEIMRSAGSALYGSDALGGVVSFFTKDPADYLAGRRLHVGGKTMFDGRSGDASGNFVVAGGSRRLQASIFVSYANGHEPGNKGTVEAENATRTVLNPQDRQGVQALGKIVFAPSDANTLRFAFETTNQKVETNALSSRTAAVPDITSDDTMDRLRLSVDQTLVGRAGLTSFSWSGYVQQADTAQIVNETRLAAGPTPALFRSGTLDHSQDTYGATFQGRKAYTVAQGLLVTFGADYKHHAFDMVRDRLDLHATTGAVVPPVGLILPSKYFPKSDVGETGAYVQGDVQFGRLRLIPGVRFDRYSLDADESDRVFLDTLSPVPVDMSDSAVSAKLGASYALTTALTLHGQYAGGFRAPSYNAVNSGFTNLLAGYTSVPNPSLEPERSDNVEAGVRATIGRVSAGATVFSNHYDNFIDQVQRGADAATGLLEFQYQNVAKVTIQGVELQADARLSDTLRLRASYAVIRGDDVSGAEDLPLNSIAPDQGIIGLAYDARSRRWGGEFSVRATAAQSAARAGAGLFAPEAFAVADLTGWFALGHSMTLRGGILNLTDTKYFEWTNVRGRSITDPVIDRYSSPGVSGLLSLSYGW